jgi:hypothetical protein
VSKLVDMTDKVIGRLTVKERIPAPTKHMSQRYKTCAWWRCECDCGSKNVVRSGLSLRQSGSTASCGCVLAQINASRRKEANVSAQTRIENINRKVTAAVTLEGFCEVLMKIGILRFVLDHVDWKAAGVSRTQFNQWLTYARKRQAGGSPLNASADPVQLVKSNPE